jgi:hypothetical protein
MDVRRNGSVRTRQTLMALGAARALDLSSVDDSSFRLLFVPLVFLPPCDATRAPPFNPRHAAHEVVQPIAAAVAGGTVR